MPFIPRLTPWIKLTANGVPQFLVARKPMLSMGVLTEVGEPVPPQIVLNRMRLRQLYEARMIVPEGGMLPAYQIPAHRQPQPIAQVQASNMAASASVTNTVTVSEGYTPPKKRKRL